jgi:hypothetical protein
MDFEDAKKTILEMAKKVEDGTLTKIELSEFVLSFRWNLFQSPPPPITLTQMPEWHGHHAITCSCAPMTDSCNECGPGYTTGFTEYNNQIISFKIAKEQE